MVSYPALFEPDAEKGGYVVTFPDFAYGVTQGESVEEADRRSTFRRSEIRKSELARRTGIAKTNIDRLFDLHHASRVDQLEAAFRALGKMLVIDVKDAA